MKKSYKKMGALALAIAMAFGVSTNAFAEVVEGKYMELTIDQPVGKTVGYTTKNTSTVSRYCTMALEETDDIDDNSSWKLINSASSTVLAGGKSVSKSGSRTMNYVRGRSTIYNSAASQSGSAETLTIRIR